MAIDKEELQWWIEDHKSKFYGLCAVGIALVGGLLFWVVSLVMPEPEVVVEEPDTFEEIEIGSFDTEGAIQEQKESEEERRNREYGYLYSMSGYSYLSGENYEYGFVGMTNKNDGNNFRLLVNSNTYTNDYAVSERNWNFLMQDSQTYTCRGTFEHLDSKTIAIWRERDYREVLDLFKNKEFNADTAKKWDELFVQCKVEKGYRKNDKNDKITPEDMSDILNEMYFLFEDYLLSLDSVEADGPLTAYLKSNPLPTYNDVMVVKTPLYICEKDGNLWSDFGENGVNSYFDTYWNTYFLTAEDIFINEGDKIDFTEKEMQAGIPYKMTKAVNFSMYGSLYEQEFVMWYKTTDRQMFYKYIPATIWDVEGKNDIVFNIPSNAEYFGYYLIGESYPINNQKDVTVIVPKGEELVSDTRIFKINDNVTLLREYFCGTEPYLNVSEFIMLDGQYEMPAGKCYLRNDTEHTICLSSNGREFNDFAPNQEFFFSPSEDRTFTWRVLN